MTASWIPFEELAKPTMGNLSSGPHGLTIDQVNQQFRLQGQAGIIVERLIEVSPGVYEIYVPVKSVSDDQERRQLFLRDGGRSPMCNNFLIFDDQGRQYIRYSY